MYSENREQPQELPEIANFTVCRVNGIVDVLLDKESCKQKCCLYIRCLLSCICDCIAFVYQV